MVKILLTQKRQTFSRWVGNKSNETGIALENNNQVSDAMHKGIKRAMWTSVQINTTCVHSHTQWENSPLKPIEQSLSKTQLDSTTAKHKMNDL